MNRAPRWLVALLASVGAVSPIHAHGEERNPLASDRPPEVHPPEMVYRSTYLSGGPVSSTTTQRVNHSTFRADDKVFLIKMD